MTIPIDYGYIFSDEDPLPTGYMPSFNRCSAQYRRSQILDSDKNILSEIIENNPDKISEEEEKELHENHLRIGDELEKVVSFPNGNVAKIEYWLTPKYKGENSRRLNANYMRSVLFDENGEIISEIMERNPYYIPLDKNSSEESINYVDEHILE